MNRIWKRILAPTDLSDSASRTVQYAHSLAEQSQAELHVVFVAKDAKEMLSRHGAVGTIEVEGTESSEQNWLALLLGESGKVRRIEHTKIGEDPAEVINVYAQEKRIDLIVMATHGRTGLKSLLMGSVTSNVLRQATCPVLVLPPGFDPS